MKKLFVLFFVLALIFIGCFDDENPTRPGDNSGDTYEPDNTYGDATYITINGTAQSHNLTADDADWYSFSAQGGSTYSIETFGSADTYLELYSTDGSTILTVNDDGSTDSNALIEWTCPSGGTYYFKVRGFSGDDTGNYSVSITSTTVTSPDSYEPDNTYSSATAVTVNGTAQTHTLTADDADWFSFAAQSGTAYSIETFGNINPYLELYSTDGATLLDQDDNSSTDNNALVQWTCVSAGTYYFRVRGYSTAETGSYSVSVSSTTGPTTDDSYEPDNTYGTATPISVNGTAQSHNLTTDDMDWFSFSAQAGAVYVLLTSGTTDTYLELYSTNGATLLYEDDDSIGVCAGISWTCSAAGTYYFKVRGYNGDDVGDYSISVSETITGTDEITGTWLLVRQAMEGSISMDTTYSGTESGFILVITADSTISFENCSTYTDRYASAYTDNGSSIIVEGDTLAYYFQGNQLVFQMNDASFTSRMYLDEYTGQVPPSTWPPLGSGGTDDEYEPDNTYLDANPITSDGTAQYHTFTVNDTDWYMFSAQSGYTYILETGGSRDTYLMLYDADGTTLLDYDDDGDIDYNALLTWICEADGVYYFSVHEYSGDEGDYSVAVTISLGKRAVTQTGDKKAGGSFFTRIFN